MSTSSSRVPRVNPEPALRRFALLFAFPAALYLVFDVAVNGVLSTWAFTTVVVHPVEVAYGFHAEWLPTDGFTQLIITEVTPGGRFDRAGVRAGYAFLPAQCSWFSMAGGCYALLADSDPPVRLALLVQPSHIESKKEFAIPGERPN